MDICHETPEETQQLRRLLRAAVDHYPRLLVVQCSLQWPRLRDGIALNDIIAAWLSAVSRLSGEYAEKRQAAGKPAPPTRLRALWGMQRGELQMLLMLNSDTFYHPQRDKILPEADIRRLPGRACDEVMPQDTILTFPVNPCMRICRHPGDNFGLTPPR